MAIESAETRLFKKEIEANALLDLAKELALALLRADAGSNALPAAIAAAFARAAGQLERERPNIEDAAYVQDEARSRREARHRVSELYGLVERHAMSRLRQ